MSVFNIVQTDWKQNKNLLTAIRQQVFIIEQKVPPELELDESDLSAIHFLAYAENKQAVGTARLLRTNKNTAKIGRMAVLKTYRHQGCGMALLQAGLHCAEQLLLNEIFLHAQHHAIGFYQKAGFTIRGNEFMDAGIPHREMFIRLTQKTGGN